MQRVLLFVNPVFEQRQRQRTALARVASLLRDEGFEVELVQSLSPLSAGEQAREAVAAGFDAILVCGGDGTLFRVLQGVAGTEIPVGILPFGTGNVLVQNLKLPRDPVEAARRLLLAKPRTIPLGRITCQRMGHASPGSYVFTIAAGLGLHAALMHAAASGVKHLGGRAAYFVAGARLLLQHPVEPFEAEITGTDGEVTRLRTVELIAVRVGALNRWRPGGDLQQPLLRIAVVPETSRLGLAYASYQALMGTPAPLPGEAAGKGRYGSDGNVRLPVARYYDAVRVVCRPAAEYRYGAKVLAEADGEVLGDSMAEITIADETLNLLWPE